MCGIPAKWLSEAADQKDREARERKDFLADVNHQGERAVFYSTRHGHDTALAEVGVRRRTSPASTHHASRTTTARHLHSSRKSVGAAVALLPDLSYDRKP